MNGPSYGRTCDNASDLHGKAHKFIHMVFLLLSLIVAVTMIAISISMMRQRISSGTLIRAGIAKEYFSVAGERVKQSVTPGPLKPFLVVVLPDGTIVTSRAAGQV